jgi:hypothetical protein
VARGSHEVDRVVVMVGVLDRDLRPHHRCHHQHRDQAQGQTLLPLMLHPRLLQPSMWAC